PPWADSGPALPHTRTPGHGHNPHADWSALASGGLERPWTRSLGEGVEWRGCGDQSGGTKRGLPLYRSESAGNTGVPNRSDAHFGGSDRRGKRGTSFVGDRLTPQQLR